MANFLASKRQTRDISFSKIMTGMIIVLVISNVTFYLSSLFYFKAQYAHLAESTHLAKVKQIDHYISYTIESVKNLSVQLSLSEEINHAVEALSTADENTSSLMTVVNASDYLANLENIYPFIASSAIYTADYCIYDKQIKAYTPISEHSDTAFINQATTPESSGKLILRNSSADKSAEPLLSYVYQYTLPSTSFEAVTLVINIRPNWIIENSNLDKDDTFFALDTNKQIIVSNADVSTVTPIANSIYPLEKIDIANETAISRSSEDLLITTYVSGSQRWILAVGTPLDTIFSAVKLTGIGLFLIISVVLGASILAAYYSSKKIYSPIKTAMKQLNSLEKNQFKDRIIRKHQAYQRAINYNHDFSYLLEEWQKESPPNSPDFSSCIGAILVQVANYSALKNDLSETSLRACLYAVSNVIHEIFEEAYPNQCLQIEQDRYILIYDCKNADGDDIKKIEGLTMRIRSELERILSVSTVWSNSFGFDTSFDVSRKIHELNALLSYKFFTPDSFFYDLSNYSAYFDNINYIPDAETEQQLSRLLSCGNFKEALPLAETAFRSTYGYAFNVAEINIQRISYSILASVKKFLLSNGFPEMPEVESIMFAIKQSPSLNGVIEILSDLFSRVEVEIHTRKENKQQILIESIIEYISNNFSNQNLSVELIAEAFSMSPLYLGRVFKNYTQKNMSDYINELRIEYAKKMLVLTDKKIAEIWPTCGFSTKSNFYLVFKNRTTLTPSEYRHNHKVK